MSLYEEDLKKIEWAWKAEISKLEFLTVCETCKAVFDLLQACCVLVQKNKTKKPYKNAFKILT